MGKITKARAEANQRYIDKAIVRYVVQVNKFTEQDILEKLQCEPNKQGYIKSLIRADIAREEAECE